jgi:Acetyl-CoA carboxylase, carboxyltransferase component (subunits alpha and beta)
MTLTALPTIASQVATDDPAFQQRCAAYQRYLAQLQERSAEALQGGSAKARKLHQERGQMLPRERITALTDPGTPFIELAQLAGADMYEGVPPGATIITGVGWVCGRACMLIINDATVKGGTMFGMTTKKHTRAQLFAWQHRLPCITMVQSGGGFLPDLANIFPDEGHAGSIMYNQVKMSSEGIAQIAIVHGPSTAGGAYIPALCDEVVIIRKQGAMFLGSPQLVFAATGEVIGIEPLGGAEMHSRLSGVTDHIADDDRHALEITRHIVAHLGEPPRLRWTRAQAEPPRYDPAELYGLARTHADDPYTAHEVIARLVDGSRFQEFKQLHGETLVTGFAHIEGIEVGVLAGNGALTAQAGAKGGALHRAVRPARHPAAVPRRFAGLFVGRGVRTPGRGQARRQAHERRGQCRRAQVHADHRPRLRRGLLRAVRARAQAQRAADVAQRARRTTRHHRRAHGRGQRRGRVCRRHGLGAPALVRHGHRPRADAPRARRAARHGRAHLGQRDAVRGVSHVSG